MRRMGLTLAMIMVLALAGWGLIITPDDLSGDSYGLIHGKPHTTTDRRLRVRAV